VDCRIKSRWDDPMWKERFKVYGRGLKVDERIKSG
jgi:hypothetical protein